MRKSSFLDRAKPGNCIPGVIGVEVRRNLPQCEIMYKHKTLSVQKRRVAYSRV